MKNIIVLLAIALLSVSLHSQAQEKKPFIEDFSAGIWITTQSTLNIHGGETKPVQVSFAPTINIGTAKTHHHFAIGSDTTIQSLNGYYLKHNWDIYCFGVKSLVNTSGYGAIGIEKALPVNSCLDYILYLEVGTNFSGATAMSMGVVTNIHLSLKKEKAKKSDRSTHIIPNPQQGKG